MRREYYGDKRDFVKWTSLLLLARRECIKRIVHVAMWTDGGHRYPQICTLDGAQMESRGVNERVFNHFYDANGIKTLGDSFGIEIEVWPEQFTQPGRSNYFACVNGAIEKSTERTVWFFDPDTGIEPNGDAKGQHVTLQELSDAFDSLKLKHYLACYQHNTHRAEWRAKTRERLSAKLRKCKNQIEVFRSSFMDDVIILAVEKS